MASVDDLCRSYLDLKYHFDPAAASSAGLERLRSIPGFLDAARDTLDEPPSVFVDIALGMLGGGGELVVQLIAALDPESPEARADLEEAGGKALEALKRFGTALRDEIEPAADPHAFAVGEEQFSRRLHYEHALTAGAPELWRYGLHLQEETQEELATLAARMSDRPWRDLVEELRGDAPESEALLPVYQAELDRAHGFIADRELVSIPRDPVEVVATPKFLVAL